MKRQEITPEIRKALRQWYDDCSLTQAEIAEKVGLSIQGINKWFTGKASSMRYDSWKLVQPFLASYLNKNNDTTTITNHADVPDCSYKNYGTKLMAEIFERLNQDAAGKVFEYAEKLFQEQQINYFIRLTDQEKNKLAALGVFQNFTPYEKNLECSPAGLCWLINMSILAGKRREYLSPLLLRELLEAAPDLSYARQLCIRLFPIEVYSDSSKYWQWTFYLHGSPPPWYLAELEAGNLPVKNGFSFPPDAKLPFRLHPDIEWFNVILKDDEIKKLKEGQTIVVQLDMPIH